MNRTVVRLAREYVTSCEKRRLEILQTKTVTKSIDQFNWLVDMFKGYTYELDEDNQYYVEWLKVKEVFNALKVKARNISLSKLVDVVILKKYNEDSYEVAIGRNRFIVMNRDLMEVK